MMGINDHKNVQVSPKVGQGQSRAQGFPQRSTIVSFSLSKVQRDAKNSITFPSVPTGNHRGTDDLDWESSSLEMEVKAWSVSLLPWKQPQQIFNGVSSWSFPLRAEQIPGIGAREGWDPGGWQRCVRRRIFKSQILWDRDYPAKFTTHKQHTEEFADGLGWVGTIPTALRDPDPEFCPWLQSDFSIIFL